MTKSGSTPGWMSLITMCPSTARARSSRPANVIRSRVCREAVRGDIPVRWTFIRPSHCQNGGGSVEPVLRSSTIHEDGSAAALAVHQRRQAEVPLPP